MFTWIGLIWAKIKVKCKEKKLTGRIKRERKLRVSSKNRSKQLRNIKLQNRIINITIIFNIILCIAVVILIGTAIFGMILFLQGGVASNQILYDDTFINEDNKGSWDFTEDDENGFFENNTDGNYPKDYTLKIRAQMIELVQEAVKVAKTKDVAEWRGYNPEPAWLLGVSNRETNGRLYYYFIDEKYDLFNSLVMTDDPCGKNSSNTCNYLKNGFSHYEGGSVINGKDTGNPYTNRFNTSSEDYAVSGRNHAIGPFQFESIYVYTHAQAKYGSIEIFSEPSMDEELGFLRPNPLYIPDAVQGIANKRVMNYDFIYNHSSMIQNNESTKMGNTFKDLDNKQKNQVYWAMAGTINGIGNKWQTFYDEMIETMIDFLADGGDMEHLISDKYYSTETHKIEYPSHYTLIDEINSAGLKFPSSDEMKITSDSLYKAMYYGVQELSLGRLEYDKLVKEIAQAEKEDGGTLTDSNSSSMLPLKSGSVTSYFGYRGTGQLGYHRGMDFGSVGVGTPVYMPVDGIVTETNSIKINGSLYTGGDRPCGAVSNAWNGNYVEVQPVDKPWLRFLLCHMADLPKIEIDGKTVYIKDLPAGTVIRAGTQIGVTGNTGCSSGPHLHFEVSVKDQSKEEIVYNANNDGAEIYKSIPPLHSLYGEKVNEIMLNSGIDLGNQNQMVEKNKNIYWRSKDLNSYMWFSLDKKEDNK